jgi:hypothetical protein
MVLIIQPAQGIVVSNKTLGSLALPLCGNIQLSWTLPHQLAAFGLTVFLNIFFDIANARLDFTGVLLDIAFHFHACVVQYPADDFLDFSLGFFYVTFYLIFVHDILLIKVSHGLIAISEARNVMFHRQTR